MNRESLNPKTFDDYIGQGSLKRKLKILLEAAQARGDALDHLLIHGPPGLGKTTIAKVIANHLGSNLKVTSGPVIERTGDIAAILMSLQDKDILFIDEIHRMNRAVEEMLYPAMEEGKIDLIVGKGPTSKALRISLKNFTLIGATTKASLLSAPLRDRFGFLHKIDFYSAEELAEIVIHNMKKLGFNISKNAALNVATISRGTPRIANRFLKRIRDLASVNSKAAIDEQTVKEVLSMMDIDSLGLDRVDRALLKAVADRGPIGIDAICSVIGEDRRSIESMHEPFLVKSNLIERTPRGRVLTPKGYKHILK